jgi:glycosyltransferase involved in cell wall biosynthesis
MKVDIIMRTKDRTLFLERAIKDVLAQSYKNWFLCIINDGGKSSDVDKLVKKYKSHAKQIKVIHHAKSKGMEAASNAGIKATNGELIVIHDDDDTWHPDFLKKCVEKLQEPMDYADVGGVCSSANTIYEDELGKTIKIVSGKIYSKPFCSLIDIMQRNLFPVMVFMYYRKCLDKVGLYDHKLPVLGDWDFNRRFLMQYEIFNIEEILANYHIRKHTTSVSSENSSRRKWDRYKVLMNNKMIRESSKNNKDLLSSILISVIASDDIRDDIKWVRKINNILKKIRNFVLRR